MVAWLFTLLLPGVIAVVAGLWLRHGRVRRRVRRNIVAGDLTVGRSTGIRRTWYVVPAHCPGLRSALPRTNGRRSCSPGSRWALKQARAQRSRCPGLQRQRSFSSSGTDARQSAPDLPEEWRESRRRGSSPTPEERHVRLNYPPGPTTGSGSRQCCASIGRCPDWPWVPPSQPY